MTERTNDLSAFAPVMQRQIVQLCRRKNAKSNRGKKGKPRRACVDSGLCCFECQDETGARPVHNASGIVADEGGRDAQRLDERSEQSPTPEGGDAQSQSPDPSRTTKGEGHE